MFVIIVALNTTLVIVAEGHRSLFPCDLTLKNPDEAVYLVLWYKGDEGEPLYRYGLIWIFNPL